MLCPFSYLRKGFRYRPTSFYGRPLWVRKYNGFFKFQTDCKRGRHVYKTLIKLNDLFLKQMNNQKNKNLPFFLNSFLGEYTHDDLALPTYLDEALYKMLKTYEKNGYFDNTLLVFYSDHGNRLSKYAYETEMGKKERKMPFLSIRMPNQLLKTDYYFNLKNNRNRLVSFFDVYQTLRQFLHINANYTKKLNRTQFSLNNKDVRNLRGISLFEKIPVIRSCSEALIPDNYCACLERSNTSEEYFKKEFNLKFSNVVDFTLDYVNNITSEIRNRCVPYILDRIKFVTSIQVPKKNRFKFVVIFQPGDAWFESTVEIDRERNSSLSIYGKVIRLSLYGDQSYCVSDSFHKSYCFCTIQRNKK